jgi:HEAT repeat protein
MDEVERLIEAFGSRGKRDQATWKLDVLMDLGRLDDHRVVAFLQAVLTDCAEPSGVRIDALKRLREASLAPEERVKVAEASLRVLCKHSDSGLRLLAALVLGDFTDVRGVLDALGELAGDPDEPLELRYNAFTSVQRAGPTAECLALLRALSSDETLGQSSRGVIVSWGASECA